MTHIYDLSAYRSANCPLLTTSEPHFKVGPRLKLPF
jgi:hypothetical protein